MQNQEILRGMNQTLFCGMNANVDVQMIALTDKWCEHVWEGDTDRRGTTAALLELASHSHN